MTPWPRKITNFPIILIAVCHQYVAGLCIMLDIAAKNATSMHVLDLIFPDRTEGVLLTVAATMAWAGFRFRRKIDCVMMLMPQQLLLFISAGGAAEAIIKGQFADGVLRSHAFLLVDQCPMILIAFFHSWAMMLILRHGEDRN